jgi:CBS domain containing-hemolysin-like protein
LQTYSAVLVSRKGDIIGIITKADLLRMLWGDHKVFKRHLNYNSVIRSV